MLNKKVKERIIERYLRDYHTYKISVKNCEKQLDYMFPTLVSGYSPEGTNSIFYISNNTERAALDRIESKRALDLKEEIAQNNVIITSIDNAVQGLRDVEKKFVQARYFDGLSMIEVMRKMNYSEEKSVYRIRRRVLDSFLISLNSLLTIK